MVIIMITFKRLVDIFKIVYFPYSMGKSNVKFNLLVMGLALKCCKIDKKGKLVPILKQKETDDMLNTVIKLLTYKEELPVISMPIYKLEKDVKINKATRTILVKHFTGLAKVYEVDISKPMMVLNSPVYLFNPKG